MSALIGFGDWGWGLTLAPADGVRGNTATIDRETGLSSGRVAELQGQNAKEAIDSLEGITHADKLPDVDEVSFPGPIAERFFWSNDDVIGIQGPVGSGKTTTLMKSRLRRAIEMPTSSKSRYVWFEGACVPIEP